MLRTKTLHKVILIVGIVLFFLIALSTMHFTTLASPGLTCELTNGPCTGTCVFSLNQETNSHAGDCSYGDWKVCCKDPTATLYSVIKTTPCNSALNEGGVINLNQISNSHAENYTLPNYPYHVCLNSSFDPIKCKYDSSCKAGACLASLNQETNSHMGSCTEYPTKICCGYDCSGTISVSNDVKDCGNTQFTVTVRNTGFADLTVDINDELWEDKNCDGNREGKVDEVSWTDIPITSGSLWSGTWTTNQAADPNICYNHTIYFCSKPFGVANTCWKGNLNCIDEATAGNIARQDNFGFTCNVVAGVCGDGVINVGEECDPGPPMRWGTCEPYEKCNRTTCECYDFRPLCTGCKYYDWCDGGLEPGSTTISCCVNKTTGLPAPCCLLGGIPETDCSIPGAVYNYLEVNASYDYCFNADCDITGKCIDQSWAEHEMLQRC